MPIAERGLADILTSVRRPDGYCMICVDFTNAEAFRIARIAETGVPITLIDMTVRALALACNSRDEFKTILKGYRRFQSPTLDIGCSVATSTTVAPIVVFGDAPTLSLEEIHEQRVKKTKITLAEEQEKLRELEKSTRFLLNFLRRFAISRYLAVPRNRKRLSGTIMISAIEMDDMEWMCPAHISGSLLVGMGGINKRPQVVEDENGCRVEARLCGFVTFMIDQRIVHPMRSMRAARRFKRLLERPELLV
jgi:pyruvate/2-oxoglutarate dehydrogenase complex dihydrolipoamide acyltransferase (E2) component